MHAIEDFVRLCQAQAGKPYVWGAAGPDEFDCSGLVMWAAASLGVKLPHYSGDQFQATRHIAVGEAGRIRGALLFEGQNASQHVVVVAGPDATIEARGRAYGVGSWEIAGRPWTCAGLIPGFAYGAHQPPGSPWPGVYYRLTTPHMGGDAVKWIQRRLIAHGFDVGSYGVDGDFGKDTDRATRAFQHKTWPGDPGASDGVVGPNTWNALGR